MREYTFHKLLCYLYTDEVPAISSARCLNLLELANRLCLPRLVNLVENRVIEDLERLSQNDGNEAVENCLRLLEPCKVWLGWKLKLDQCDGGWLDCFSSDWSFTTRTSWLTGAWTTCASIITNSAKCRHVVCDFCTRRIRSTSANIAGLLFGKRWWLRKKMKIQLL